MRVHKDFHTLRRTKSVVLMLTLLVSVPSVLAAQPAQAQDSEDSETFVSRYLSPLCLADRLFSTNLCGPREASEEEEEGAALEARLSQMAQGAIDNVSFTISNLGQSLQGVFRQEADTESDEPSQPRTPTGGLDPPPLSPPAPDGTVTSILDPIESFLASSRGTFIINMNLRVNGDLAATGSTNLEDLTVAGSANLSTLNVANSLAVGGLISAPAGINTQGGDIDLEGGQILGTDLMTSIEAGRNVVISGPANNPTISVPNAEVTQIIERGGGSRVISLNGEAGELTLAAGADISINGLTIVNTSTLETVRARGGCVSCILDTDVADDLTILGGVINDTVIGETTPAAGYFTTLSVGTTDTDAILNVAGNADITGLVTGNSFASAADDATVRKSGEEILRASVSIFPYALPADTGSSSFVRVSKDFGSAVDNPLAEDPTPIAGTTRIHKLVIKYSDSVPSADDVSWRIYQQSTGTAIDSFATSGLNRASLDEAEVAVTDSVNIPADDWRLEVRVPSGRIRIMDVHMTSFDVID